MTGNLEVLMEVGAKVRVCTGKAFRRAFRSASASPGVQGALNLSQAALICNREQNPAAPEKTY